MAFRHGVAPAVEAMIRTNRNHHISHAPQEAS
jgi:hypothetical protein